MSNKLAKDGDGRGPLTKKYVEDRIAELEAAPLTCKDCRWYLQQTPTSGDCRANPPSVGVGGWGVFPTVHDIMVQCRHGEKR